jgi:hypothetical protein
VFFVELTTSGLRYFILDILQKELLKYCQMVLRKGWNLLVSFNRICIRNIIRFFTVGNPTISKQLIKKREMTSIRFMSIYYISIINIQKQIKK